jgi:hypothetical protein
MRVFRFGNIIILIKDFRKFLLSFLAMLGVFVFSLVGGITYFYAKFFKRISQFVSKAEAVGDGPEYSHL